MWLDGNRNDLSERGLSGEEAHEGGKGCSRKVRSFIIELNKPVMKTSMFCDGEIDTNPRFQARL